ncbi:hypothetical protein [Endozoicomonas lisbonensis]
MDLGQLNRYDLTANNRDEHRLSQAGIIVNRFWLNGLLGNP